MKPPRDLYVEPNNNECLMHNVEMLPEKYK